MLPIKDILTAILFLYYYSLDVIYGTYSFVCHWLVLVVCFIKVFPHITVAWVNKLINIGHSMFIVAIAFSGQVSHSIEALNYAPMTFCCGRQSADQ